MSKTAIASVILGLAALTTSPQAARAGGLFDIFGVFSQQAPSRVTRQPRLELESHPRYGVWSPANRQRMMQYRFQSNFGRPYARDYVLEPWDEPFVYPGWARNYRR